MLNKDKPCKRCGKGKRVLGRTICYSCLRKQEKEKKIASLKKKKERKLNSKKYYNEQVKKLEKECDRLWSLKVRSVKKCELCGHQGDIKEFDAHHLIRRNHKITRWDVNNGVCLCKGCHRYKVHQDTFTAGCLNIDLQESRGMDWYWNLFNKKTKIYKPTLEELKLIKIGLES